MLATRLWARDESLWVGGAKGRLGWLNAIDDMQTKSDALQSWAQDKMRDYEKVVVLGMGGASLSAAVFGQLFSPRDGYKQISVLDSIHPAAVAEVAKWQGCLFIVASKSGTTAETTALYDFFHAHAKKDIIVITDENSSLHQRARADGIADIFLNAQDIGGRYSALSYFGLVPAALAGINIGEVLRRAAQYAATTTSDAENKNTALALGLKLGGDGLNKIILEGERGALAFAQWAEQMLAESLGKDRRGLVPIVSDAEVADEDAVKIVVSGGAGARADADAYIYIKDALQVGAEFFRLQFATAIAASKIGVNPFDQPDVDATKKITREYLENPISRAAIPPLSVSKFKDTISAQIYIGILVYLPENDEIRTAVHKLQQEIMTHYKIAATVGFAPRYLHSAAQLHKGGPRARQFLQIFCAPQDDVAIPNRNYTFGDLFCAQADADYRALTAAGAIIMRADLDAATATAIDTLTASIIK